MDQRVKELIAIGASAAVNCRPCLKLHLAECDRLSPDRNDVREAVEIGMKVNRGAAGETTKFASALLGVDEIREGCTNVQGCGC